LTTVDNTGAPPPGYVGGAPFANDGRGGTQVLPTTDANGNSVKYHEWDVNAYTPGVNRGQERIVTGNNGSAYYTNNHYVDFTEIR
jgi:ribonuclease T1